MQNKEKYILQKDILIKKHIHKKIYIRKNNIYKKKTHKR